MGARSIDQGVHMGLGKSVGASKPGEKDRAKRVARWVKIRRKRRAKRHYASSHKSTREWYD